MSLSTEIDDLAEHGFPREAAHLREHLTTENVRAAWRKVRAFKPASFGEGMIHTRAKRAMGQIARLCEVYEQDL